MPPLTSVPAADVPPAGSSDVEPLRCQYPGCDNTVEYSGRGRRPKHCEEHKATTQPGTTSPRAKWANRNAVEQALLTMFQGTGMVVSMVNQKDGKVVATGGRAVTNELLKLGDVDRQWRKWLDKLTAPGKYGPLVLVTFTAIVLPIMANHNMIVIPVLPSGEPESREGGEG